jgi:DNA-binding transcriptional MerR regulator
LIVDLRAYLKVKVMRIGDLATPTGASTSTTRFYEAQGLLAAADRLSNGDRDCDRLAVEVVKAALSACGAAH